MEHSALHGAQLLGMLLAFAAPLLALAVLRPALRRVAAPQAGGAPAGSAVAGSIDDDVPTGLAAALARSLATWALVGAAAAAAATFLNLVVQVSEIEGVTILAGTDPSLLRRFATATAVGRLAVLRGLVLAATAAIAWAVARARDPLRAALPWALVGALALAAVVLTALVSHAAAQPDGRALALSLQVLHLAAAAAWIGALAHLLAARSLLSRAGSTGEIALVAEVVRRFSPVALAAAAVLFASGGVAAVWSIGPPVGLVTSAYGLTLLVKLSLVATLLVPAWVNYRIGRPRLARAAADAAAPPAVARHGAADPDKGGAATAGTRGTARATLEHLGRMLELEATAGLLVVAVAGVLGSVAPPAPDGAGRLTPAQAEAVVTPRLPQTRVVDPATWVGAEKRTDDDLRYSEFMHNWSGVVVVLLGLAWLVQAQGGRTGRAVGRLWPLLLVPFAVFVAIASDPEVWPMGRVGPLVALTDPVVFEHRIGALLIVALAWLGLREERRGGEGERLGRALAVLMIGGSLLLLGHAHSSFGATESLTTLINVQHAVVGGLGLLAGVVRWLELRGLFPRRVARLLWPSLVIAVGACMALSYRELA